MTDRDTKKEKESARPGVPVSALHERASGSHPDPFDDDGLDEVLEKALGESVEPRLLLLERLLSGTRIRREV